MTKLFSSLVSAFFLSSTLAQVGINTESPQSTLDVNGSIQLRNELQISGSAGTPGQVYFSQNGSGTTNDWKNVNVPFMEGTQYQLVNTYAKRDQSGIDFTGYTAPTFSCASSIKSFPFNESFETSSTTRSCWQNQYNGGSVNWSWGTGDGGGGNNSSGNVRNTAQDGSVNARFLGGNNQNTRYVSPIFDLTNVTNPKVRFWYGQRASSTSGSNNRTLRVYYRTSSSSSWILLETYDSRENNWTEAIINLPNKSATYQIAFEGRSTVSTSNNSRPSVMDNITVYGDTDVVENISNKNYYNKTLSSIGESITAKNWTTIPGLDLDVNIKSSDNKVAMIFQTGVESQMNTASGNQTAGNVRYMCGIFRRAVAEPQNNAVLVALRADQINNTIDKSNANKAQTIYNLNYTVINMPAGEYIFSTACRRLSYTDGVGADNTSLLSIGNAVGATSANDDFMFNSILKMDVIELVTFSDL